MSPSVTKPPCLCTNRKDVVCTETSCSIAGPGAPGERNNCRVCWLRLNEKKYLSTLPCLYLGKENGKELCPTCVGKVEVKTFDCALHQKTTLQKPVKGIQCCKGCPDFKQQYEWVSTPQLVKDSILLASKLPLDVSGIVGIPRSGLLPASTIATHLHLPLYELTNGQLRQLGHGSRGHVLGLGLIASKGPLLVVDDTYYAGGAMQQARSALSRKYPSTLYSAVYVKPPNHRLDYYGRLLPSPHLLEWNVANNGPLTGNARNPIYGRGIAFDLDGIIVHDVESGGKPGSPYLLPRTSPLRLIATGRHESTRLQTEKLLTSLGVRWEKLEMFPDSIPQTSEEIAKHKAHHYNKSGCGFFLESDPFQAELISQLSHKPVICPIANKVY